MNAFNLKTKKYNTEHSSNRKSAYSVMTERKTNSGYQHDLKSHAIYLYFVDILYTFIYFLNTCTFREQIPQI